MNRKRVFIIAGILLCIGIILGVSYALWNITRVQKSVNTITTGCLKIDFKDENPISIEKAYPLTDEEGMDLTPYSFTLTNLCNNDTNYNVNLEMMETERPLSSEYVAISFDSGTKQILGKLTETVPSYNKGDYNPIEGRILASGTLKANASVTHNVRLWMDESVTMEDNAMNKSFISKIVVNAVQNQVVEGYMESILNGAYPVLKDNLIPVSIDDTGRVTKANLNEEWYSYENKRWANAVILLDKTIEYQDDEEIPESNIESYFVWIPKYSYELWDLGEYAGLSTSIEETKAKPINIKFGITNTSDSNSGECTTPMTSGSSGNCKIGDYMTPPAFVSMGTNGLWVGKFETGYKGATSIAGAQVDSNDSNKIEIKPNVYSWRNIRVANAHQASYNYQRALDSHMMKGTEWGAVAYLQHSKYGSVTSVRINNNSAYITGYAAVNEPTMGYNGSNDTGNKYESTSLGTDGTYTINYTNPLSQVASTTGNYTGVYDMSGGSFEYTMSVLLDSSNSTPLSGRNSTVHSGFNGSLSEGGTNTSGIDFPSTKYYDTYTFSDSYATYNRRILGDGTSEFGPFANVTYGSQSRVTGSWHADEGWYISSLNPWAVRGGEYHLGLGAGIFGYERSSGLAVASASFRIVLAI